MADKISKYTRIYSASRSCMSSWFVIMLPLRLTMLVMLTSQKESTWKKTPVLLVQQALLGLFITCGTCWPQKNIYFKIETAFLGVWAFCLCWFHVVTREGGHSYSNKKEIKLFYNVLEFHYFPKRYLLHNIRSIN
jgi:hypothetical protein